MSDTILAALGPPRRSCRSVNAEVRRLARQLIHARRRYADGLTAEKQSLAAQILVAAWWRASGRE